MRRQLATAPEERVLSGNGHGPKHPPPITCALEFITPEMAVKWLQNYPYERQRDMYGPHVDELVYVLQQQQYSLQGVILCKYSDQWRVTNGQHRLQAIVKSGIGTWEVVIRKDMDEAATADEYSRTDRGKRRQVADALRAHGLGSEYDLTPIQVNLISAGVGLILSGFSYTKPAIRNRLHLNNQDTRVHEVEKWLPAGARFFKTIREPMHKRYRPLVLAATLSVALVNFHYTPERAEDFWFKVAHEESMELDDPAQALLGVFARRVEERSKAPVWARLVSGCWNAFLDGRHLAQPSTRNFDQPIVIAGSPYKGRLTSSTINPSVEE